MGKVQQHKRAAKAKRQIDTSDNAGSTQDRAIVEGVVEECLPNTMFRVKVTESDVAQLKDRVLLGTLAGKMRLYRIRVMPGDTVKGYVSAYDPTKLKITYRTISKQLGNKANKA